MVASDFNAFGNEKGHAATGILSCKYSAVAFQHQEPPAASLSLNTYWGETKVLFWDEKKAEILSSLYKI